MVVNAVFEKIKNTTWNNRCSYGEKSDFFVTLQYGVLVISKVFEVKKKKKNTDYEKRCENSREIGRVLYVFDHPVHDSRTRDGYFLEF